MVDRDDDRAIGVKSSAILFGDANRVLTAALAIHQQVLIKDREPAACFRAFLNNNLFGLAVFAGIALDYLFAA
jgi:4-hydroxybenzoate polyprenyltransferase